MFLLRSLFIGQWALFVLLLLVDAGRRQYILFIVFIRSVLFRQLIADRFSNEPNLENEVSGRVESSYHILYL